jgi:hypothetical protein
MDNEADWLHDRSDVLLLSGRRKPHLHEVIKAKKLMGIPLNEQETEYDKEHNSASDCN